MGMKVTVEVLNGDTQEVELREDASYADLLEKVGFNPEGAVVVVDGRPKPEDGRVEEDVVKVMRTVSGG